MDEDDPHQSAGVLGETPALTPFEQAVRDSTLTACSFFIAMNDVVAMTSARDILGDNERYYPMPSIWAPKSFNRPALILIVTAWETYIEDMLLNNAILRIESAKSPTDVASSFNAVVAKDFQDKQAVSPARILPWATDWKQHIIKSLRLDIRRLNTPDSESITKLSKRYLGLDLTAHWGNEDLTADEAKANLDKLIKRRGRLTHRASDDRDESIDNDEVAKAVRLAWHLMKTTAACIAAFQWRILVGHDIQDAVDSSPVDAE